MRLRFAQKRTHNVVTGLDAPKPRVIDVGVVGGASTVVEPRTTGSQQLRLPDLFITPHLGHTRLIGLVMVAVVTAGVAM